MKLEKYSIGIGDRFGKEGKAQLEAVLKMHESKVPVTPVWNKSYREHLKVGTRPENVKEAAEMAVKEMQYSGDYLIDADHVTLKTVDPFIPFSDFFTIDVADFIGKPAPKKEKRKFLEFFKAHTTPLDIPGIDQKINIPKDHLYDIMDRFLMAMKQAGKVYRYILSKKDDPFFTEVSIDEVDNPQSPVELFFILTALAYYKVPVNTIAPKFSGKFNKGVNYQGDLKQFEREFEEDLLILKYTAKKYNLPENLKLSVHSGSDKFSIYPVIHKLIKKHDTGLHLKTAGTTWLEELIGLAESEGEAFLFAKNLYRESLDRYDEVTKEYAAVLSINKEELPDVQAFSNGAEFASALRHDPESKNYNPHFRQLLHCAYGIAGEKEEFPQLLEVHRITVEENVFYNLYERHLKPLFMEGSSIHSY